MTATLSLIQNVTDDPRFVRIVELLPPRSTVHLLGRCLITVTPPSEECGWWLSISHPDHLPFAEDVFTARRELIPPTVRIARFLIEPAAKKNAVAHRIDLVEMPGVEVKHE